MNPIEEFQAEVRRNIEGLGRDLDLQALSRMWIRDISPHKWSYNFSWMGRPAIQFPNDAWAMQEIIWSVKPDLIIETGIAHGGSLIFSASMLALLDMCDATATGEKLDPRVPKRKVLGVDIDIRAHNRAAIEAHPMSCRIDMIQGSSISRDVIEQVHRHSENFEQILICLDSNHTHEHVLAELEAYAPLTSIGSYCCAFDTIIEDMPADMFQNRPWGRGNNPKTAVWEYLRRLKEEGRRSLDHNPLDFEIDRTIENKLLITVAPDGYLKRVK